MTNSSAHGVPNSHPHVFLAPDHERSERRTWLVIVLCGAMMAAEITGGWVFGSIALVADGLHMSTHAGALLLTALAYSFARKHASDARFCFGTGKFGDLAGFSSAIVLAMIALLIGFESVSRFFQPIAIHFAEAIPIACLGLAVNVVSAWLLAGGHHHHGHGHGHDDYGHTDEHPIERHEFGTGDDALVLEVHEDGVPPRFRLLSNAGVPLQWAETTIETLRPDGGRQIFRMLDRGHYLESAEEIPEPHEFTARIRSGSGLEHAVVFQEHHHGHAGAHRDNNMRAAVIHVAADAAVSILVIVGLVLARSFGWLWMDPLAGIVGACVIASWSFGLIRDTGAILLDMNPDRQLADQLRRTIEVEGDRLNDLHLWRVGPGHLAAIVSIATKNARGPDFYRKRLAPFKILSHLTVEVVPQKAA